MKKLKNLLAVLSAVSLTCAYLPVPAQAQGENAAYRSVSGNGTFETTDTNWEAMTNNTGEIQASIEDGVYSVNIVNTGGVDNGGVDRWDCLLWNNGLSLTYGHTYRITYSVYADNAGHIYSEIRDDNIGDSYWHNNGNKLDMTYQADLTQEALEEQLRNAPVVSGKVTTNVQDNWDVPYYAGWSSWQNDSIPANQWVTFSYEFVVDTEVTTIQSGLVSDAYQTVSWNFHFGGSGEYTPFECFPAGTTLKFDNLALVDVTSAEEPKPQNTSVQLSKNYWADSISESTYYLYDTDLKTLRIGGTGSATDAAYLPENWKRLQNNVTSLIVEEGITDAGHLLFLEKEEIPFFQNFTHLKEVTLSKDFTQIEENTFNGCTALESVTILNPDCQIADNAIPLGKNAVLYGYANSTAQAYAEKYGYTFKALTDTDTETAVSTMIQNERWCYFQNIDTVLVKSAGVNSDQVSKLWAYTSKVKKVVYADGVNFIDPNVFTNCYHLEEVVIPRSTSVIYLPSLPQGLKSVEIYSTDCQIEPDENTLPMASDGIIYGYAGSTAEAYAKTNKYQFKELEALPEYEPEPEPEPIPEAPTEPTTEAPTEPATEISPKPFTNGKDNWNFRNSAVHFGDTYNISRNHLNTLYKNLSNTDVETVKEHSTDKWDGSCYGMAVTSILASQDILKPSDYQMNASCLYDIDTPTTEIKSLINYYYMLQFTQNVKDLRAKQSQWSEKEKINYLLECLEDDSPVLLAYNIKLTQDNSSSHAVVAYGVEYGAYDGEYDGKILIYDNITSEYDEKRCLLFSTKDGSWKIPSYYNDSNNGSSIQLITDDLSLMNSSGYLKGTAKYHPDNTLSTSNMETPAFKGMPSLHSYPLDSDGTAINAGEEEEIKLVPWFTDSDSSTKYQNMILKNNRLYTMTFQESEPVDLRISYPNSLIEIQSSDASYLTFNPNNTVTLKGEAMNYEIQNVLNSDYTMKDWYSFTVSGTDTSEVNLKPDENGYILSASNLNDVTVKTSGETAFADVTFSTDADSVLLYEIDEDTIGVKIDTNSDGTYDKLIAQTPALALGDADKSGDIDILDVITLNKALMGKETITPAQLKAIDFNGNGKPDSDEAMTLLKFIVGMIDTLS